MSASLNLYDIYEQNLNFLIGAGASHGFLPTLQLKIKDRDGNRFTFETLAKHLDDNNKQRLYTILFMYYYRKCIKEGLPRSDAKRLVPHREKVLNEYTKFLETLIKLLEKQNETNKKCNIYTTNYDTCFEIASDRLNANGLFNFVVNDGADGFQFKRFHTRNYNRRVLQKGIFDRDHYYIPQINILHPHGSVYWKKDAQGIQVDYSGTPYDIEFNSVENAVLKNFESIVENDSKTIDHLLSHDKHLISGSIRKKEFWEKYSEIPIVNPTKWKFHETVFEEAYYQILRHLSFELERPNSVLLTFGFSFSDEHILHLVQRSLSNPSLIVYISCFNDKELLDMQEKFRGYNNVKLIADDCELTFEVFNKNVFALESSGGEE